jgi:hypothetical protein
MSSKDYDQFIWSCFPNDMHAWREGLQFESLLRLTGNERQKASELILSNLQSFLHGAKVEKRVIESAGWLQLHDATPYLVNLLEISQDLDLRAQIGLALHRIQTFPKGIELAMEAFEKTPVNENWNRWNATDYLAVYAMEYKSAVRILLKAINDQNGAVAFHVVGNLKRIFLDKLEIKNLFEVIAETLIERNRENGSTQETGQKYLEKVSELIEREFLSQEHWK